MTVKTIDAQVVKKMFLAGALNLEAQKEYINELNVFPVPDGDTGTNMTLTIYSAVKEVNSLADINMESLAKAISSGSLRGARGNSGVILSQLFRGFAKEIREHELLDVTIIANAFSKAVETAYKAVMKPKEGTILTVARAGSQIATELVGEVDDIVIFGEKVLKHMQEVLDYTPELLPVLKEAGVVDSGGQGLMEVLKGAYNSLIGKEIKPASDSSMLQSTKSTTSNTSVNRENISTADITFGYCTEFIILLEKEFDFDEELKLKAYLESIGDSIVVVADDDVVKVHVHTNDPGLAIQKALTYGQLSRMKIDNMREEHNEALELDRAKANEDTNSDNKVIPFTPPKQRKKVGFIAVSIGEGIGEIFRGLGVDYLVEGGQTMNPSAEDILNAIDNVNADSVFVLPNNKNIILAVQQAQELTKDKKVILIPSKTVPQGIAALINYVYEKTDEENEKSMIEEMKLIKTGQVTYAIRDTKIDGKEIKQGDFMGLDDKTIKAVGSTINDVSFDLLGTMIDEESEIISLYYGEEVSKEDADELADMITELYPDVDVEVHYGGQPIYYYIMSVE